MTTLRALKVLGLLVVAALAALFSGGPAGAGATTGAVVAVVAEAVPEPLVRALPGGAALAASGAGGAGPAAAPATADTATTSTATTSTATTSTATTSTGTAAATTTAAAATTTTTATTTTKPSRTAETERPARGRAEGTPCHAGARACVDLSANQAWLIDDGEASYGPVPITHGRKGYRTPPGTFAVSFKNRDHVSSIYDAPMPYSVFFNGGIAFHQGSLTQRSHGCIHLSRSAAKRFFAALSQGDTVQVVR